jgi:LacI family transcriptional regulator
MLKEKKRSSRILVSMSTADYTQRRKLQGILDYAHGKGGDQWQLQLDLGGFKLQEVKNLARWQCSGIIAYITGVEQRRRFLAANLPTVLIEPFLKSGDPMPKSITARDDVTVFVNDYLAEGRAAAQYFMARHFVHFAYVHDAEQTPWSEGRCSGFQMELDGHGLGYMTYRTANRRERRDFALELPKLARWLKRLPKPVAVFVANDERARQVLMAANMADLDAPEEISILGVDNDELICETVAPSLSSVDVNDISMGYDCARRLDDLMAARTCGCVMCTRHSRIVSRVSTDMYANSDPFVAKALAFARNNLDKELSIGSIASAIGYSARMLHLRVKRSIGKTMMEEVRRMRLDAAAKLLSGSDKGIAYIADMCGFSSASHLSMRFKEAYGVSPFKYRHGSDAIPKTR